VKKGFALRIQVPSAFRLHWTTNEWQAYRDTDSTGIPLKVHFVDIPVAPDQRAPIRFTIFYPESNRWEGRDYIVSVE
jgi:glucoamylase